MTFSDDPSLPLAGRRALVTGASGAVGGAIAFRLAQRGADVAVHFLKSEGAAVELAKRIDAIGRRVALVRADVSQRSEVEAMVQAAAEAFGGLDIIVSNAAAGGFRPLADSTPAQLESVIRHNAAPVVWLTQAAAELLQAGDTDQGRWGKVVAISSHGSVRSVENYGAIGASKAALESLTRHLAMEYGPRGINFNCVMPGILKTAAIEQLPGSDSMIDASLQRMLLPPRSLTPQDVAGTVAYLCSAEADMIQGQTIAIDGGVTVRV